MTHRFPDQIVTSSRINFYYVCVSALKVLRLESGHIIECHLVFESR